MSFDKLPIHVILEIFKNVPATDLPHIRLVCRNWAEVVSDSVALRRKLQLTVSSAIVNQEHDFVQTFIHSPYNVCTDISLRNVYFEESDIVTRLWSQIGRNIERLSVHLDTLLPECDLSLELYLYNCIKCLKHTPNLIELNIRFMLDEADVPVYSVYDEFNLQKLDKVCLYCWNASLNVYIMRMLTTSAKRVRVIYVTRPDVDCDPLYDLIESQKNSLKELELGGCVKSKDWKKYLSIDDLSLEVVIFNSELKMDRDLLKSFGKHKNLRELMTTVNSSEIQQQYAIYLPNLEKMDLCICSDSEDGYSPFPNNLIHLKSLKLVTTFFENTIVTFDTPTNCPKLEVLDMNSSHIVHLSSASLQSIIDNFSNLKVLALTKYRCDSITAAAICDKLLHLEELVLSIRVTDPDSDAERNAFCNIWKLKKLRRLELYDFIYICDDRFFIEHLRLPALTSLTLSTLNNRHHVENVTDQGISALVDNCPLLEYLFLAPFDALSDASVDLAFERLRHLQSLSIYGHYIHLEIN